MHEIYEKKVVDWYILHLLLKKTEYILIDVLISKIFWHKCWFLWEQNLSFCLNITYSCTSNLMILIKIG
jgi:hypothetical protein